MTALTAQLREDDFADRSCPDHGGPGEASGRGKHGGGVHKLLVEATKKWRLSLGKPASLCHRHKNTIIMRDSIITC
ncbi:hypothetical protein EYF80_060755 [Liparis tanakae]|uniref:Uncharacterized protein n=1 Tax=Liparis tanakae TaxID=230148 RepID=A0A4Z2EJQ8_9TELE|nr:hypothetical protein EYF80_060755 [Liparis tanakae]